MKCGFIYELILKTHCQFNHESHTAGSASLVNFPFHMLFFFYAGKAISVRKIGRDIPSQLSGSEAIKQEG
jgi:hypothetical protein